MNHKGLNLHRLRNAPIDRSLEEMFAEEWEKMAPEYLGYILCGPTTSPRIYSQRDATIAATIIQWLGTSVGSCWVSEMLERPSKIREVERALDKLPKKEN